MSIDKKILEEIKRYNEINGYLLEQEAIPPAPEGEVPPLGEVPPAEGELQTPEPIPTPNPESQVELPEESGPENIEGQSVTPTQEEVSPSPEAEVQPTPTPEIEPQP